ncbi:helix-turn-helix transcriptional regulator [Streptomyces sp. NPDC001139]
MSTHRLLERGAELAVLTGGLEAAAQGRGSFVVVEGAAGIGKSRLLAEASTMAAGMRLSKIIGRASELERDFSFGVVRQVFEPLLAHADPSRLSALWEGPAAQAREIFVAPGGTVKIAGDYAMLHGLYWLTANVCREHPLVMLIDDLQWCDVSSLAYFAFLLPRIEDLGLFLVVSLRAGEIVTDERLMGQIISDPGVQVLNPRPLTAGAAALFLDEALPSVAGEFVTACHQATGGNPLLMHELAVSVNAQGIPTSAASVAHVAGLGARAVARLVEVRLARLTPASIELARAIAILGGHADLTTAAALADLSTMTALKSLQSLEQMEILNVGSHQSSLSLSFVHPLVRAAVYDSVDIAARAAAHRRAAQLLIEAGAEPEAAAAHLLLSPYGGDPDAVTVLRAATVAALAHGSTGSAVAYLKRCLTEPMSDDELLDVLVDLGTAARLINVADGVIYLQQALDLAKEPERKAQIGCMLGEALDYVHRSEEAIDVLREAVDVLPEDDVDLKRQIHSYLLTFMVGTDLKHVKDLRSLLQDLRQAAPTSTVGGRMLDCSIAFQDMKACDPGATVRARRGLAGGDLVEHANGEAPVAQGWLVLLTSDADEAMESLEQAVDRAHARGAVRDLAPAYAFRALGWLWRGYLTEAEKDAREACQAIEMASLDMGRSWTAAFLANSLLEQGRLQDVTEVLAWAEIPDSLPSIGTAYINIDSKAQLLRLQGDPQHGLEAALTVGRRWSDAGGLNPAFLAWRSEAALCLHALDRDAEALALATEEVGLARRWQAPRALGRALRICGLVRGGPEGLALLEEAVSTLASSPARLERAKALTDLGAALRRAGQTKAARKLLQQGLDLAAQCEAAPVVAQARAELSDAGGRPRRIVLTGPLSLTPSERRVAEIAAKGFTNREIAQTLFITPKTVEVHLSAVYRKLGITTRADLVPEALKEHSDWGR